MKFSEYEQLLFERRDNGVLLVTMNRPDKYNAADEQMHGELARVWAEVSADPETRVAVITGAGKAFSAGGDLAMVQRMAGDHDRVAHMLREMSDLVYNMVNCEKPIISAINGVAVGAGTVVALLADISICALDARLGDGHVRLGVAAGDHAAILWPLLCGMAKARYYLLTGEMITGEEAERLGMVSKALPRDQVLDEALRVADSLATGSQHAIRWTKRALNNWLKMAGPIFDQSAAYEMLCFMGPDVLEGAAALTEKRAPRFPSAHGTELMPWFPDFASAVELARRQTRAAGQADPVGQYFAALNQGDARALETVWPGEVVIYDPRAGEIRGHRQLRQFVSSEPVLAGRAARPDRDRGLHRRSAGGPWWSCWRTWPDDGQEVAWPVAVVAESPDDLSVVFRTYCSQWPVDGRRHVRPPILEPGAARPGDVVGRYQAALDAGDADAIVGTFAPDGYYREPIGPHRTHRGTA